MSYETLKTVSQISTYSGSVASWILTWINPHFKTSQDADSGHRKVLTPAGKASRVLLVVVFAFTIASAVLQNYADSHLRKEAEQRGTKAIADALEAQQRKYVSELKDQFEGKDGVLQ